MTWEQVRVGLVILVGLVVLSVGVFLIGETGGVYGNRYRLVTLVRSAAGLVPGAAVELAGQRVGQVDRIELIDPGERPRSGEAVAIWMAVNERVRNQIRADSRAQVRSQGLLGDRLIDIRPGTDTARVLAPGDTVPAAASLDYDQLLAQGAEAVGDLVQIADDLSRLTERLLRGEGTFGRLVVDGTLYESLAGLSASLDTLASEAAAPGSPLRRLLDDEALYESLRGTVFALDSLTAGVAAGEGSIGRLVASDSLYRSLEGSARRTDSLLAALLAGEGSAGRMLREEELYEELLRTVTELNDLLEAVRRDPDRYVPPISIF